MVFFDYYGSYTFSELPESLVYSRRVGVDTFLYKKVGLKWRVTIKQNDWL